MPDGRRVIVTQLFFDYVMENAESSKMDEIFMLGYDAWADGISTEGYIKSCRASAKYRRGRWYVLEKDRVVVAALIVYENAFNLPNGSYGIGSVATLLSMRNTGLAYKLIQHVIDSADLKEASSFYLFSDIDMSFYKKLGFVAVENRKHEGLMVRVGDDRGCNFNASKSIEYF